MHLIFLKEKDIPNTLIPYQWTKEASNKYIVYDDIMPGQMELVDGGSCLFTGLAAFFFRDRIGLSLGSRSGWVTGADSC